MQSFARVWDVPTNSLLLSPPQATYMAGVQRTQSFAGVRGVPEKSFLPLSPPQAAMKRHEEN